MIGLDITQGTNPAVDQQVDNSRLRNAFINSKSQLQLLPNISQLFNIQNARAIFKSTFKDRIIVCTQREVFYIQNESIIKVGSITSTTKPIRMDENAQNQVTIVNGAGAWVFQQQTGGFSKLNSDINGFDVDNPVDVCVLNTFTIIVGDGKWIVSVANNALIYNANSVQVIDNSMGNLTGCEDLNNNLFIFGDGGVQRWVPSIERTTADLPFSQDPTYRDDFGCIATASLITQNNELFYLSRGGQIRMMRSDGRGTITTDGIEAIINNYSDQSNSFGFYFYHKGFYLYGLSFPEENNTFIYCPLSKKWAEYDRIILGFSDNALLSDGVYEFTNDFSGDYTTVVIQTPYVTPKQNKMYGRSTLSSVLLEVTQGKGTVDIEQVCFLQMSKDNVLYGNRVKRKLSGIGNRLFQFRWFMNYVNNGFSCRFTLELQQEITITRAWVSLR